MSDEKTYENEYIKVDGTDIFFYCDVSYESVTELCTAIKKIEREHAGYGIHQTHIKVHIMSDGGELYSGLGAMDFLKSTRSKITTIAEGMCASAATFIFLGGDRRLISPNAYILIHQISSAAWGKYDHLKDEMHQYKKLMRHIKRIYLEETNIPPEKLENLMKRDLYMSSRRCIKYGIGEKYMVFS